MKIIDVSPLGADRKGGRSWSIAVENSAKLHTLPVGLQFPPELRDRIGFDAGKKRLVFHGFMTKSEYDQLARLHHDLEYQRAVERLFQLSAEPENPLVRRVGHVLAVLVVLCLLLAAIVWWQLVHVSHSTRSNGQAAPAVEGGVEKGVLDGSFDDRGTVRPARTASIRD